MRNPQQNDRAKQKLTQTTFSQAPPTVLAGKGGLSPIAASNDAAHVGFEHAWFGEHRGGIAVGDYAALIHHVQVLDQCL